MLSELNSMLHELTSNNDTRTWLLTSTVPLGTLKLPPASAVTATSVSLDTAP